MKKTTRHRAVAAAHSNVIPFPAHRRVRSVCSAEQAQSALLAAIAPIKASVAAALSAQKALDSVYTALPQKLVAVHSADHALAEGSRALLAVLDAILALQASTGVTLESRS